MPESVNAYVYGYTSGIVSRTTSIRVQFASMVASPEQIGQSASGIISFSPTVDGEAIWENEHTLIFEPKDPLLSGTLYVAKVQLSKVFDNLPADAKSFEFDFRTRDQFMEVSIDGFNAPNPKDLRKQELRGTLRTVDFADEAIVEGSLSAKQQGKELPLEWTHDGGGTIHSFVVTAIDRGEKPSAVELSWNGKALDIGISDNKTVEVPSLSDFKVTDARIIQEQEQYILISFSDPLQESQNPDGLISLTGYSGNFRFIIDGNQLRAYPSGRLTGEQQLNINIGIKNANNSSMGNPSKWVLTFESRKPEVRLVGRGVVMPNSDGLVFPFEAIALNAVQVEVFKIYNNNILQFLQSNRLNGNNSLRQVGRIVMQKMIPLQNLNPNANTGDWNRYALDLKQLIDADKEAIYQVRIGYMPEYANYFCANRDEKATNVSLTTTESQVDEDGEPTSIMEYWYGPDGYYENYNWSQREDPCYSAYYNSDRFISRNVIASNLGIIAKGGKDNNFFVTVADLRTTDPVAGANLQFYDYQQQLITEVQTDAKGMAEVVLNRKPFVLIANQGDQRGYLKLQNGYSLSLSRFDVAGVVAKKGLKGYFYGERGVWRPGDSIFMHFILEDKLNKLPPNYPITFEITDPRGQKHLSRTTSENVENLYPLHFVTPFDAPTGPWMAKVMAGGATFEQVIRVETIKPNRLKIELDFGKDMLSSADEPINATLRSSWLHGAPAANLEAKVEVEVQAVNTAFEKYKDFEFDDPARRADSEPKTIFDGPLNEQGVANVKASLTSSKLLPGKLQASFKTRVFEKGGDFSTDNVTMPYSPFSIYAGVHLPQSPYGEKRLDLEKEEKIAFVAVDEKGQGQANRNLKIGLYKVEWRWWWDQGYDQASRYNSSNHYDATETTNVTTNNRGEASWNLKITEWGRYLIRVCDAQSGHCSGDYFYAGYPWYEDDGEGREAAAVLNFSSDKTKYSVGETVELNIPTAEKGRALITLENGTKVIQSFWSEAVKGENKVKFTTTADMKPTVYAHVSFLQPHAQVENDLPIRMYGVIPIEVEDPATHLAPIAKMPEELAPEATFTLEVSEKEGRPMAYTISVVDEGLLGLTRFKTPNPWNTFYAREALGVRTWDMYDQVLGAYGAELERVLSIGGDGELIGPKKEDQANRFKPVVRHLGPFYLKKGGKAKHEITLPNYVGAVRAMVVANNNTGAYGAWDKSVPVKKPLMVLATLPRVLGPGETLSLPVNVFAMDKKVRQANIRVEEKSGLVHFEGNATQTLNFSQPGDKLANFRFTVGEKAGIARFVVHAEGSGEKASQEIEIQIRNPNPVVTRVEEKVLQQNEEWATSFTTFGMEGTNEGILEVSNIPPINLGQRLNYLLNYPYGCLEQTLSSGFPQLYVGRLLELDENQKENVPKNIEATINRLKLFQTSLGGFAYWPGNTDINHWSTTYAGHFLLEAKALGYTLPPGMLEKWIQFQKKVAKMWSGEQLDYGFYSRRGYELDQAYRLYTLALAGKPEMGAMNRLRERKNLQLSSKWRLAAAYAVAGKKEIAEQIINQLSTEVEAYQELADTYGSDLRDRAMILETLIILGKQNEAATLVKYISEQLSNTQWHSTQTLSYALLAIGKFVGESGSAKKLQFAYQVGSGQTFNAGSPYPVMQIALAVDTDGIRQFKVKNPNNSVLFARLILRGQPVAGQEKPQENNLKMAVTYQSLEGKPLNPANLPQGTDFIAAVTVTHPGIRAIPYKEMALQQIFPSGWEVANTRMDNVDYFKEKNTPDYRDFRDDRVNTFFDIFANQKQVYYVQLNAAYQGRFYLPAVSCEAMYDHSINAQTAGQWVEVGPPSAI
ncbi:MAG: membrane protein [Saprospiraceae bacterium]|nr:MAG: membrane protein [Saprospiraceae bacterium]